MTNLTNSDVEKAARILRDIQEIAGAPTADETSRRATDYVGTKNGLCRVDTSFSIYGGFYYIGPVIGHNGEHLKPRRYYNSRYEWNATYYLAECLDA